MKNNADNLASILQIGHVSLTHNCRQHGNGAHTYMYREARCHIETCLPLAEAGTYTHMNLQLRTHPTDITQTLNEMYGIII